MPHKLYRDELSALHRHVEDALNGQEVHDELEQAAQRGDTNKLWQIWNWQVTNALNHAIVKIAPSVTLRNKSFASYGGFETKQVLISPRAKEEAMQGKKYMHHRTYHVQEHLRRQCRRLANAKGIAERLLKTHATNKQQLLLQQLQHNWNAYLNRVDNNDPVPGEEVVHFVRPDHHVYIRPSFLVQCMRLFNLYTTHWQKSQNLHRQYIDEDKKTDHAQR